MAPARSGVDLDEGDMTDRDHFAAAALTGLLAQGDDGSFSEESYARAAYRWADAMLRERSRAGQNSSGGTDSAAKCTERDSATHDAAPAARAQDLCTGDTQEPVAWGVVYPNDEVAVIAFKRQDAEERATASDRVVPLYRKPTLTDAEREAVSRSADTLKWMASGGCLPKCGDDAATLRGLLARLA